MPIEIPWDIRERAEGLYIIDGLTYEQVAERTGVSATQLKRWGSDGSWAERKREYRTELSDIRRGTVQLRAKLLRKVLDSPSPDPQDVYAFARIEQVAAVAASRPQPGGKEEAIPEPAVERAIRTPEDAVAALSEALEKKINAMLTSPSGVNLSGVKDAKQCMDLIEKLRAQFSTAGQTTDRGVTEATLAGIREQLKF